MPTRALRRFDGPRTHEEGHIRRYASLHFLKIVEENCDVGFWTADLKTDLVEGSLGLFRILGLDPSAPLSFSSLHHVVHPEDRALHPDKLGLLRSGRTISREFRIIRPDRTLRYVMSRAEVILGPDHKPSFAIGVFQDVTSRQLSEASAREEHRRFSALLDVTAAVVFIIGPDGAVRNLPQWETLTGQTADEVRGVGWLDAVHPDDRERTASAWSTSVTHVIPYNTEYRVLCADGVYRWFNARGVPVMNPDGSVHEWVGVVLQMAGPRRFANADAAAAASDELITSAQIRGARGMLNLSYGEVARRAGISPTTMRRLETEASHASARPETLRAVKAALEMAGVEFVTFDGGQPAVRPRTLA